MRTNAKNVIYIYIYCVCAGPPKSHTDVNQTEQSLKEKIRNETKDPTNINETFRGKREPMYGIEQQQLTGYIYIYIYRLKTNEVL